MIHRTCPLCGSSSAAPELSKPSLELARCLDCGMVYASPVPAAYLDGTYYEDAGRPFYLSPVKLASDYAPVRFAREIRFFRRFCHGGAVLDVGCSTGGFLYQLKTQFPGEYQITGTDVSSPALEHAQSQGIPVRQENFLSGAWEAESWDAITFWAVLEHVSQPREFLTQAARLLKPGGLCFALVPNYHSLAARILKGKYRYVLPQHLNYFTKQTLGAMGKPGLEPLHFTTMHFNPVVILQDALQKNEPTDAERAQLLGKTTALKQNKALFPLRWGYALAEGALRQLGMADNCLWVFRKP